MTVFARLESDKTPMVARIWRAATAIALVAVAGPSAVSAAWAQPAGYHDGPAPTGVLEEAQVIRLARTRVPRAAVADATDRLAAARTRTANPWPNPALQWARETVLSGPTGVQGSQDVLGATLPIDVLRPKIRRTLVASGGAWMRAEAARVRTEGVLQTLSAYQAAVLAKQREALLSRSVSNLDEAARVVVERQAAGEGSGYQSARVAIAQQLCRSQLAQARGQVRSAKARLAVLLDLPAETLELPLSLMLLSTDQAAELVRRGGAGRKAVRLSEASVRLAQTAEHDADWAWLPRLEVGAGVKRANNFAGPDGYGYAAQISLDLPIFDRGQTVVAEAEARRALAVARDAALKRNIQAELRTALAIFQAAREELHRFDLQTADKVETLLIAAQSGYREGERSIVELLDAQRAQTAVAERHLNLLSTAKQAELRLRAAAGELQ